MKSLDGREQIVLTHIEVQGQKEDEFPLRLFQYYYRLFECHKKPIITLAILTDDNKSWHPKNYQTVVWDFPVLNFNFQSCKLLDYRDDKQALEGYNNPFAIVVLAHLGAIETKRNKQARYALKFRLTRQLYEKGYNRDYVVNLFKVIDWVLVIPDELELEYKTKVHALEETKKMAYMTNFERLGREESLQQGLQQGLEKARNKVAKNLLAEGLPVALVKKVTQLSDLDLTALEECLTKR